jgi:hypothetical protein
MESGSDWCLSGGVYLVVGREFDRSWRAPVSVVIVAGVSLIVCFSIGSSQSRHQLECCSDTVLGFVFQEKQGKAVRTASGRILFYRYVVGQDTIDAQTETNTGSVGDSIAVAYSMRFPRINRLLYQ